MYECRFCGEKFDSKTGRTNHERSHKQWDEVAKLVQKEGYSKKEAIEEAK